MVLGNDIIPIFKNKGSQDDPNNYRGIILPSCLEKLFTCAINGRLVKFFDINNVVGLEQAGFRANHSTVDHIFTLHCIADFFLTKRKRLYCLFVDYEKAFDRIRRTFLWEKLLNSGVNGRLLNVIIDMYQKAKSL